MGQYKKPVLTMIFLLLALFAFAVFSIGIGPVQIEPGLVLKILLSKAGFGSIGEELETYSAIVYSIRLPRTILAILIGASLAVAGAALQGLFRNPLADPQLIGVSGGAALAAAFVIILGKEMLISIPSSLSGALLPFAAFIGGLAATWLVYFISTKAGKTSVATMLLAGIAINALAQAGIGYLIFGADDDQIRDLTFWRLGSLSGTVWTTVFKSAPFLLISIIGLPLLSKQMNVILLGENEARHLGVNTEFIKKTVIILSALGIGAAVAVSGTIGFVGLVVPHLLRLIIGPDHRFLMPASVLFGGLLLLASDLFARTIVAPAELPIGIVTATIGAPFFLWLLIKKRALTNLL